MEQFVKCRGFGGKYSVSNEGRVFSHISKKYMEPQVTRLGYIRIRMTDVEGLRRGHYVHRLVAKEFCEGYEEGLEVNHIDGDKLNNKASNLEWVTREENVRDTVSRGTHSNKEATEKLKRKVLMMDSKGEIEKEFSSISEAVLETGLDQGSISKVCMGQRITAGGFKWKYAENKA